MALTSDLWTHSPRRSEATYKHLTLTVTSRISELPLNTLHEPMWKWRVSGVQGPNGTHATRSSLAVDRIGACVEAEETAQEMAENMMPDDDLSQYAPVPYDVDDSNDKENEG
jgi:hypothetical protein